MACNGDEECGIRPGTVTPKKLPKQSGGGGHEFVTDLPDEGDEGVEYVLMDDISDCSTYRGTYIWNEGCATFVETSGSGGGGVIERYTFENTATGWRAKRNNNVIFTYVDKDTIDDYQATASGFQIVRNGSVIFSHDDTGGGEYTITATENGWVFKKNGEVLFTYTNPEGDPSDGTYLTSGTLTTAITGTTTLALSSINNLLESDIVIGETLIFDSEGTVGKITAVNSPNVTVQTITAAPGNRRGVRLGAVDAETDLPATITAATSIGWQTPVVGDYAYVREDSTHDDGLTEYVVQAIDGSGNITWAYSHTLNSGDYVVDIYKYGDYPGGNPIPKNPDGSVTLPAGDSVGMAYKTNIAVGGIPVGTQINASDTVASIVKRMLVTTYYPTYVAPSASLTYTTTTYAKVGSTVTSKPATVGYNAGAINLQGVKQNDRGGAATKYYIYTSGADTEYSDDSTSSGSFTVPALTRSTKGNIVITGKVDYAQGAQPKDSDGNNYQTPLAAGSVTASKTIQFIQPYYWGNSATTTVSNFNGLTENVSAKGQKQVSYTTSNEHMVFAYDASYGNLSSILDPNGFEVIGGWTKSSLTVDGFNYNVYVADSATTDTNAKFTFKY